MGNETAMLNVITFWKHYYHKYRDQMQEAAILEDEYEKYLMDEGILLQQETD